MWERKTGLKQVATKGMVSLAGIALMLSFGVSISNALPTQAQGATEQVRHLKAPKPRAKVIAKAPPCIPDVLIVMPGSSADQDDVDGILKDNHCTILDTMGTGALKAYKIQTERGKMVEVERKLYSAEIKPREQDKKAADGQKDKKSRVALKPHEKIFKVVGRNYLYRPAWAPNDPRIGDEWHLSAVHCHEAWDKARGNGVYIAVLDTGSQASISDLQGKTSKGFDASNAGAGATLAAPDAMVAGPLSLMATGIAQAAGSGAATDPDANVNHGTHVATTAAGTANNGMGGAGIAPNARVYPVRISHLGSKGSFETDGWQIMAGMLNVMANPYIRIVNVSYEGQCYPSPIHEFYQQFYLQRQGLVFVAAGNNKDFWPFPPQPYLNVVTAVDENLQLADFSSTGTCTSFTAPGVNIYSMGRNGQVNALNGTSFSTPIVAGIAALILSRNPMLPAPAVQAILRQSCVKVGQGGWTPEYGFGMPDADTAVRLAGIGAF